MAGIGLVGVTYAILKSHARCFMPSTLLGRGVTFMNVAFIGGSGVAQWLSGRFVQASLAGGPPPTRCSGGCSWSSGWR